MDAWITTVLQWLLTQGWPGLIIILLCGMLWLTLKRLDRAHARIEELQDKRVNDARADKEDLVGAVGKLGAALDLVKELQAR